ncbi:HAD-IA family hydrolase [soil metagenome]
MTSVQPDSPHDTGGQPADISTVVFDLGGVLVDWDPTYVLDRADVEALDIGGVQRELDLGVPVSQVRARWHETYPDVTALIDRYFDQWHRTVAGPIDPVVHILDELRAQPVGLYALSNFSGELFRQVRHRFAFVDWFDGLVISGDEGVVKPDGKIYRLLIERHGLEPAKTVFIDDRTENVEAATVAGLVGVHFTSAAALRRQLRTMSVL